MLRQRIITALVLLAVILPILALERAWPFQLLAAVLLASAMWEWARLNQATPVASFVLAGLLMGVCGLLIANHAVLGQSGVVWWVGTGLWIVWASWMLALGMGQWQNWNPRVRQGVGFFVLLLAWLAVCNARALGLNFLLSILGLVFAADIGAYFAGRALGTRIFKAKLAPTISPGKSREGVVGGWLAVMMVGVLWMYWDKTHLGSTSFFSLIATKGAVAWIFAIVLMVGLSVVGDLVESLIKRVAGAKDSSQLLPGHGGVLDRFDALLPTLPTAMAIHSLF